MPRAKKIPPKPDKPTVEAFFNFMDSINQHADHTWEQVGRCVYCVDCRERLYQGRIGSEHQKVKRKPTEAVNPSATAEMRARWMKD